ncbi:hypothetical protein K402DRAFT_419688 [Aulographum hederae CBS 113979]|uniref:Uncharacterized protein n=1 Tax=Aulographum hederae CBS 113979 TaxID=1176131 RepID=A0A6G1H5M8_9PEZI|nr:hypothetical protein K402DRAFT_419688 [Aulographum hederae CBS 113979]
MAHTYSSLLPKLPFLLLVIFHAIPSSATPQLVPPERRDPNPQEHEGHSMSPSLETPVPTTGFNFWRPWTNPTTTDVGGAVAIAAVPSPSLAATALDNSSSSDPSGWTSTYVYTATPTDGSWPPASTDDWAWGWTSKETSVTSSYTVAHTEIVSSTEPVVVATPSSSSSLPTEPATTVPLTTATDSTSESSTSTTPVILLSTAIVSPVPVAAPSSAAPPPPPPPPKNGPTLLPTPEGNAGVVDDGEPAPTSTTSTAGAATATLVVGGLVLGMVGLVVV